MPAANVRVVARFRPLNGREKALIESGTDDRGFSITYALFSVRLWITASWSPPFLSLDRCRYGQSDVVIKCGSQSSPSPVALDR